MNGGVIIQDEKRVQEAQRSMEGRRRKNALFLAACLATASLSVVILIVLLAAIFTQGLHFLSWDFLTSFPNPSPEKSGIYAAMLGTVWVCVVCAAVTFPLGVATAIFLEEYRPRRNIWLKRFHGFVQLNIANLAGVPSVVYGIIGLTAFVQMFNLFGTAAKPSFEIGASYSYQYLAEDVESVLLIPVEDSQSDAPLLEPGLVARTPGGERVEVNVIGPTDPVPNDPALLARTLRSDAEGGLIGDASWYHVRLPFGRGVLTGGLTLSLVILPILIVASQEAIRAVPDSLREGALGLGATPWQTVWRVVLPSAVPGMMTGFIISMSRAIGEAAPLLMIAGIIYVTSTPGHLMDDFSAMPLQIYNWAQRPQEAFHDLAASGIIVLLVVLLTFNAAAIYIRYKTQKPVA